MEAQDLAEHCLEDMTDAMDDRDRWLETVSELRAICLA